MANRKWIPVDRDFKPILPPENRHHIDTKEKAVAHLIQLLDGESRKRVREARREDVWQFWSWGAGIRKELGLWGQNVTLLEELSPGQPIHADDASIILMKAVWDRLNEPKPKRPKSTPR